MENQPPTPMTFQQPVTAQQLLPKKSKTKTVLVSLLFIIVLAGAGYLGYTYKKTNDALKLQSQKLSNAYKTVGEFQAIINKDNATSDFAAKYNDKNLSRELCANKAVGMFDVHLNDKYAVFRYLCADTSYAQPIRLGSLQKQTDGSFVFTYGSSTAKPLNLPS